MIRNLVIGGGLSGTTIAVALQARGEEVLLLESSPRLGGKIETLVAPEACYEFGPNSFSNQPAAIFRFLDFLGLMEELIEPTPAGQNRYILKEGKIVRLPAGPHDLLTTRALSFKGKLRFLREFFYVPPKKEGEESVRDFFSRHFGREVADYFADPFVSGVFAGDVARLSLPEAFPMMAEAEERSSSLIRHLLKDRKTSRATPKSFQLRRGLESIFHRAREKLGDERIHLEEEVVAIAPEGKGARVLTNRGDYEVDTIYLTTPSHVAAKIAPSPLAPLLSQIDYAPVVTIHLKVSREESFSFDGFGILIPSSEGRRILGSLWNSNLFPSLFPDKRHHYLTVYLGGVRRHELVEADESVIRRVVIEEVRDLFSLANDPIVVHVRRHLRAIPQYNLGYGKILKGIEAELSQWPFLKLSGNYLGGPGMPKTVAHALSVVEEK